MLGSSEKEQRSSQHFPEAFVLAVMSFLCLLLPQKGRGIFIKSNKLSGGIASVGKAQASAALLCRLYLGKS